MNGLWQKLRSFWRSRRQPAWKIRPGRLLVIIDASWVIIAPAVLWFAAAYVPVTAAGLGGGYAWALASVIFLLIIMSILMHGLAHALPAGKQEDGNYHLFAGLFGDPAHYWPAAPGALQEALAALAGPLVNLALAGVSYAVWFRQFNPSVNVVSLFLLFFNLALALFNLIPAYPFDGGRLVRAAARGIAGRPAAGTRWAYRLAYIIAGGLAGWGIALAARYGSYNFSAAGASLLFSVLMLYFLFFQRGRREAGPEPPDGAGPRRGWRGVLAGLALLPLFFITFCLVPLNYGLEAPGFTAAVGPMVQVPAEYRHATTGRLLLVTVIPQTPILAGEWLYAHIDRSIKLEPAEQIVPRDRTAKSVSQEGYQQLLDSKAAAVIAGLRLAGYTVDFINDGVTVTSVLESSPSYDILQPGDVITGFNGKQVKTVTDLTDGLKPLAEGAPLALAVDRGGQTLDFNVTAMAPAEPGGSPRIGIGILQHTAGYNLPFTVSLVTQKVDGGPSAGLMFTLGIYTTLTGDDLTGGKIIAGTGTIDADGNVGAIGGGQQKVVSAQRAGAVYFLCPPDNYADALTAAGKIQVVSIATAQDAIDFLHSVRP